MRWEFVMNGNDFENKIVASEMARKVGYKFFLHDNKVYFTDYLTLNVIIVDTGLTKKDLI